MFGLFLRFYSVLLQALSGFLMMMTQNGKLLYISDNAAEYLGHSMVSTNEFVHVGAAYRCVWQGIGLIFDMAFTVHRRYYVEIKCQLDATDEFLLYILLLAQHVSGTIMPIIRSSRVL
jgi:hypothetical protein